MPREPLPDRGLTMTGREVARRVEAVVDEPRVRHPHRAAAALREAPLVEAHLERRLLRDDERHRRPRRTSRALREREQLRVDRRDEDVDLVGSAAGRASIEAKRGSSPRGRMARRSGSTR